MSVSRSKGGNEKGEIDENIQCRGGGRGGESLYMFLDSVMGMTY